MSASPFPPRLTAIAVGLLCIAATTRSFAQPIYTARDAFTLGGLAGFSSVFPNYRPPGGVKPNTVVGSGRGTATGPNRHALLWNDSSTPLDLHPAGFLNSEAQGVFGDRQVGYGRTATSNQSHALLWNSTAASAVDLHPAGWLTSSGLGIGGPGGSQQVGYGTFLPTTPPLVNQSHALLWSGSAASFVDLHPTHLPAFTGSVAWGTDGSTQFGFADGPNTPSHAMLWTGTAASARDLHPMHLPAVRNSSVNAIANGQQVGFGFTDPFGGSRALLWNGTAASAIDLTPSWLGDFVRAEALGTSGFAQIGYVSGTATERFDHALIWFGSAAAHIDLHELLPDYFASSYAMSFDNDGDIFGLAIDAAGDTHLVEWDLQEGTPPPNVPLPPAALAALACLPLFQKRALRRRRGPRA